MIFIVPEMKRTLPLQLPFAPADLVVFIIRQDLIE